MANKLKDLKWESVALEGFPVSGASEKFNSFVALEECTNYGLDFPTKLNKKKKQQRQQAHTSVEDVPVKRPRLSNGFKVESCHCVKPSLTNESSDQIVHSHNSEVVNNNKLVKSKQKLKLGENTTETEDKLSLEEMMLWSEFQMPEEILKALAEQGFKTPTKIQELTLPSAMLGRRDILGAAETGSGKTLAFGIPILAGIMKLKEKQMAGQDVYEIQYKKSSAKKKTQQVTEHNLKRNRKLFNKKAQSDEDGYSSGNDEESNDGEDMKQPDHEDEQEIEVPIRKKDESRISADEGNDSDESDNYVHLSEMNDSEESSDDEEDEEIGEDDNDGDGEGTDNGENDVDNNKEGIGCVKVIDNVELPNHVIVKTGKPLYALILTPTRELAIQISRHLISAAKYTGIRIAVVVGGMAQVKQERVLSRGPEIVVATPGRLWELIQQGQTHLQQLDNIKFLAIDETDRMLERNHFEELHPLLERLNSDDTRKSSRQNFVFSATLTLVHDLPSHMRGKKVTKRGKIINRKIQKMTPQQKVKRLVSMIGMTDPKVVDITTQNLGAADTLTECRIACSLEQKDHYLYYILRRHPGRTIVFCNSIGSVKRLTQLFGLLRCKPLPLHASMPQRQRLKNLERFRDDPHGVLVATDVAARGLDIPNIDHVVHYQVPRTAENYVHRSGRTARATKEGLTILMMEPGEAFTYAKLCRTLNKKTELPTFPVPCQVLTAVKETVSLARDVDRLELQHRRDAQAQGWLDKAAKEMDMLVDEDFLPTRKPRDNNLSKTIQIKKKQLDNLLAKPVFPKGFSFKYPTLNNSESLIPRPEENALQVMKKALETGALKKEKRKSKNASFFKLEKKLKDK